MDAHFFASFRLFFEGLPALIKPFDLAKQHINAMLELALLLILEPLKRLKRGAHKQIAPVFQVIPELKRQTFAVLLGTYPCQQLSPKFTTKAPALLSSKRQALAVLADMYRFRHPSPKSVSKAKTFSLLNDMHQPFCAIPNLDLKAPALALLREKQTTPTFDSKRSALSALDKSKPYNEAGLNLIAGTHTKLDSKRSALTVLAESKPDSAAGLAFIAGTHTLQDHAQVDHVVLQDVLKEASFKSANIGAFDTPALLPQDRICSLYAGRLGQVIKVYMDGSASVRWDDGEPQGEGLAHERVPRHLLTIRGKSDSAVVFECHEANEAFARSSLQGGVL